MTYVVVLGQICWSYKVCAAVRNEMRPLEDERAKHEKEAELAGRVLTSDFSPDDAYMALFDKCFRYQRMPCFAKCFRYHRICSARMTVCM